MDIRANSKNYQKILKAYNNNSRINKEFVILNLDEDVDEPVIIFPTEEDEFQVWTNGFDNVMSFLKYGYVKISDGKYCPLIKGKCKGEKCALYLIENNTGDCSIKWNAIISIINNR